MGERILVTGGSGYIGTMAGTPGNVILAFAPDGA